VTKLRAFPGVEDEACAGSTSWAGHLRGCGAPQACIHKLRPLDRPVCRAGQGKQVGLSPTGPPPASICCNGSVRSRVVYYGRRGTTWGIVRRLPL